MISVEHLTKWYGDVKAVDDLSFQIEDGHVYGFLGPNGAGKSTTMNIMTGCLSATSGSVKIGGCDIFEDAKEAKKKIGYLPEQPPLYMAETPEEYLKFVGEAKGLRGAELKAQIDEVIAQTKLEPMRKRQIAALSKGYKQRVGIAQALLGDPEVIILDEPTVGLDPIQIIEIRALIKELGQKHTVIFSSHILSEVQTICDEILIIAGGKLIALDKPENLEKRLLAKEVIITADSSVEDAERVLSGMKHITSLQVEEKDGGHPAIHIRTDVTDIYDMSRAVFMAFAKAEIPLLEMTLKRANLEEVFLELTDAGGKKENAAGTQAEKEMTTGSENSAAETEKGKISGKLQEKDMVSSSGEPDVGMKNGENPGTAQENNENGGGEQ